MDRDQAVSLENIEISLKDVEQQRICEDVSKSQKIKSLEEQVENKAEVRNSIQYKREKLII